MEAHCHSGSRITLMPNSRDSSRVAPAVFREEIPTRAKVVAPISSSSRVANNNSSRTGTSRIRIGAETRIGSEIATKEAAAEAPAETVRTIQMAEIWAAVTVAIRNTSSSNSVEVAEEAPVATVETAGTWVAMITKVVSTAVAVALESSTSSTRSCACCRVP